MRRRWQMLALLLLLMAALGMRLYRLSRLPPGLFHDEAYNTLDAQALAEGWPHPRFYDSWEVYARTIHTTWPPETTRFPVFLEGNYGREPLFHYVGALVVALVGPKVWALRLVAALAGTIAVLSTYLVTRELFADIPERASRLALLAAGVATGIYSLLAFSRLGLRIITLVPLTGLTVAFWWRAGRTGRLCWWVLAGLLLGLAQYTYIPARLLPLIVAYPALAWIVRHPSQRPRLIRGTLVALALALIIAAPLIAFYVRYPAYLILRADAIADDTPGSGLAVILANVVRVPWGLIGSGDPNPILNLPGRPLLDLVQALFLVIGLLSCLHNVRRLACSFLLLWASLMHLPSILSGTAPTFGRSIGGVLPVAIVVAVGVDVAWSAYVARWPRGRTVAGVLVLGALVLSIGLTAYDYFVGWAKWPGLPRILGEDMATVGRYVRGLSEETIVYITPTQKYYATLLLAMGERERPHDFYGPAGLLPAGVSDRETVYLILEGDETSAGLLEVAFPTGRWEARNEIFDAYQVPPAAARVRPQHAIQADFAGRIRLIGFDLLSEDVRPGDTLSVRLTWQTLRSMDQRYTAFVHLLGPRNPALDSPLWAQDDHEPGHATYATDRWFPGEVVLDTFHLQIPGDAPAGSYTLSTGFYSLATLERLSRSDAAGDTVTLFTVALAGGAQ